MLTSALDYEYITTTGIESCLVGNIIPVADTENRTPPFRFEDICYISEATRTWSYNYTNISLSPTFTQTNKGTQIRLAWEFIYRSMNPSYLQNLVDYGCICYLTTNITSLPTLPRVTSNYNWKEYFYHNAPNLLFDYTQVMDNCIWQTAPATLNIVQQKLDCDVPRILYWILFQDCYQGMKSASDTATTYFDKSYTFCSRTIKSGTGTYHTTSGGVISTNTGPVENAPSSSYPYVYPRIQTNPGSSSPRYTGLMNLAWYSYYDTDTSGYEYCLDGADGDVYTYIDFRRDDIVEAYALVSYRAINQNNYSEANQKKFEPLTQESGRRWSFKCFDKAFAQSLMEYKGADFTQVGTRASSRTLPPYRLECITQEIYVKFDHKYSAVIKQQWQWTP